VAAESSPISFAVVDMSSLLAGHPKMQALEARLREKRDQARAHADELRNAEKLEELDQFREELDQALENESQQTLAEVLADVRSAISLRLSAHHFQMVFDVSGRSLSNLPVIVAAPGAIDLTEEVRRELAR
jgi:Skp family chaperone for outer membrane proteins